jgi:hypothetical protein
MREKKILDEIGKLESEINFGNYRNDLKKSVFAEQLKRGLGEEIKANPNSYKVIKPSFYERFKSFITKLLTKF